MPLTDALSVLMLEFRGFLCQPPLESKKQIIFSFCVAGAPRRSSSWDSPPSQPTRFCVLLEPEYPAGECHIFSAPAALVQSASEQHGPNLPRLLAFNGSLWPLVAMYRSLCFSKCTSLHYNECFRLRFEACLDAGKSNAEAADSLSLLLVD